MNPSNFASIEYGKQLVEFFENSEWWHSLTIYENKRGISGKIIHKNFKRKQSKISIRIYYPAPTINDYLSILPSNLNIYKALNHYSVYYNKYKEPNFHNKSLPNALANMLLWLKDQGLLKERG